MSAGVVTPTSRPGSRPARRPAFLAATREPVMPSLCGLNRALGHNVRSPCRPDLGFSRFFDDLRLVQRFGAGVGPGRVAGGMGPGGDTGPGRTARGRASPGADAPDHLSSPASPAWADRERATRIVDSCPRFAALAHVSGAVGLG